MIKVITLNSGKKMTLDTTKVRKPRKHKGSPFIKTDILANNDIYILPPEAARNGPREGNTVDPVHVDTLAASFENNSIDYNEEIPYVYKENITCPMTGKKYQYVMKSVGNHRLHSFKKIGASHWVYHIYQPFTDQWSEIDVGFETNNHNPSLSLNRNAVINNLSKMVKEKRWGDISKEKLKEVLLDYLRDKCSSFHPKTINAIIQSVFHQFAEYTDHVEYTPGEADIWVKKWTDREIDMKVDKKGVHGTIISEGYEKKRIITSIMKYGETRRTTEMLGHVKQPITTDKKRSTTKLKRKAMLNTLRDFESDLDAVFEYKQKHGKYPFSLVGFIPQDRKNEENFEKLVSIKGL